MLAYTIIGHDLIRYIRSLLFDKSDIIEEISRLILNEKNVGNIGSADDHENKNEKMFNTFVFHVFKIEIEKLRGFVEKIEALDDMNYRYALGNTSVSFIICMLTLLLIPLAGLHFCVGLDFVTPSLKSFLSKHHHHHLA
jgi:hypothetical protein